MLVLGCKVGDSIFVGPHRVRVVRSQGRKVQLGVEAPADVPVDREAVRQRKAKETSSIPAASVAPEYK